MKGAQRAQPAGHRRGVSAGRFCLRDRCFRLGQEHAGPRCALREPAARPRASPARSRERCKIAHRRASRSSEVVDGRPIAAGPDSAVNARRFISASSTVSANFLPRTPEALAQGLTAGAFSFNSGTGRCERCGGMGFEKIEMQFLSDLYVRCAECEGKRYQPHVLEIRARRQKHSRCARVDGHGGDRIFPKNSGEKRARRSRWRSWRKSAWAT